VHEQILGLLKRF